MFSEILVAAAEDIFSFGVMVIITLAVVITIHELGHYLAARLCGVKVETFAFGFGGELFGFGGQNGGTRWSIRYFPLGGYVKLFGDIDKNNPVVWDYENNCERRLSDEELRVAFCTKSVFKRMFIVFAGPLINIILTLAIMVSLFTLHGERSRKPVINAIAMNSAADNAGVRSGDHILEMDGVPTRRLEDVYFYTWHEDPPQNHTYLIDRDGETIEINFAARRLEYMNKKGVEQKHGQTGMVRMSAIKLSEGIHSIDGVDVKDNPDKARKIIIETFGRQLEIGIPFRGHGQDIKADPFLMMFPEDYNQHLFDPEHEDFDVVYLVDPDSSFFVRLGFIESIERSLFKLTDGLQKSYKLIEARVAGRHQDQVIGGVAKISQTTGDAFQAGFYSYMMFIATFSFIIAVINLLPIPALDGGYLMFMLYEVFTGRPLSQRFQNLALIIGLAILLGIMIFANISDFLGLLFPVE